MNEQTEIMEQPVNPPVAVNDVPVSARSPEVRTSAVITPQAGCATCGGSEGEPQWWRHSFLCLCHRPGRSALPEPRCGKGVRPGDRTDRHRRENRSRDFPYGSVQAREPLPDTPTVLGADDPGAGNLPAAVL